MFTPRFLVMKSNCVFFASESVYFYTWRLLVRREREVQREDGDDNIYLE